jgi:TPP-dependent pyruvate/acetoin dehydrogenase alpha subunit
MNLEELAADWRTMTRIRLFEEAIIPRHAAGTLVGSIHLCIGQEAIAVGTCGELDLTRDAVFATYRGHGWAIACGTPLAAVAAEIAGKQAGTNGGRGGSAFLSAPDYGFYGENSIVGAHFPIAVGAALAAQYDNSGRVVVAVAGDGALNQGAVHEAFNLAAVRALPIIFIIENNRYSELTPIADMVKVPDLYRRASAYGFRGVRIDGNDVTTVRATVAAAVQHVRSGAGPVLIEATTQRLVGHYIGDAQVYRPRGEVEAARSAEPIVRARQALIDGGVAPSTVDEWHAECAREVEDAFAQALAGPDADPATVMEHLYG